MVQLLRLCAPSEGGLGLIPGEETRFHMPQLRSSADKYIGGKKEKIYIYIYICVYIYIYIYIHTYCQPTRIGLQGEFVSEIPRLEFLQKSNSCSKSRPYCISQRGALPTSKNMVNSSSILMNNQMLLEPYTKPPFPPFTLTHLPPPDTGFISGSPRLSAWK